LYIGLALVQAITALCCGYQKRALDVDVTPGLEARHAASRYFDSGRIFITGSGHIFWDALEDHLALLLVLPIGIYQIWQMNQIAEGAKATLEFIDCNCACNDWIDDLLISFWLLDRMILCRIY